MVIFKKYKVNFFLILIFFLGLKSIFGEGINVFDQSEFSLISPENAIIVDEKTVKDSNKIGQTALQNPNNFKVFLERNFWTILVLYALLVLALFYALYFRSHQKLYHKYNNEKHKLNELLNRHVNQIHYRKIEFERLNKNFEKIENQLLHQEKISADGVTLFNSKLDEIISLLNEKLMSSDKFTHLVLQFAKENLKSMNLEELLKKIKSLHSLGLIDEVNCHKICDKICDDFYQEDTIIKKLRFWEKS